MQDKTDAAGERHLITALLLLACLDAYAGDAEALAWIAGEESAMWAELIGLDAWPPRPSQLGSREELKRRLRNDRQRWGARLRAGGYSTFTIA